MNHISLRRLRHARNIVHTFASSLLLANNLHVRKKISISLAVGILTQVLPQQLKMHYMYLQTPSKWPTLLPRMNSLLGLSEVSPKCLGRIIPMNISTVGSV